MGLIPISNKVIVKPDSVEQSQVYSTLLITPEVHTRPSTMGIVVQVYKGCTEIKKGDRVIWEQWAGVPIEHFMGDVTYLVVPFDKILGRFEHGEIPQRGELHSGLPAS